MHEATWRQGQAQLRQAVIRPADDGGGCGQNVL